MTNDDTPPRRGRRRALKLFGLLGLAGVGGGAFALTPRGSNAYYTGPVSDHFDGVRFFNPGGPKPKGIDQLLRWQFTERVAAWPATFPSKFPSARPDARCAADTTRVTYIGHASHLVQIGGLNVLLDPVYSDRVSPVSFAGPKRINPPGIAFDALPKIDAILVSHNHYDHLDVVTLERLWRRDKPKVVTPLGNDAIMRDSIPDLVATALDWDQSVALSDAVTVHGVTTQHWSARGTRDRMHALWASFVINGPAHRVYAVGDSGFGDGRTFRHVAAKHPRLDLALLPIGAYEPRWFMRDQHMNPADAVEALGLCGAVRALGHHWGTFKLTNEAIDAPPAALAEALSAKGIAPERFVAQWPGQVTTV